MDMTVMYDPFSNGSCRQPRAWVRLSCRDLQGINVQNDLEDAKNRTRSTDNDVDMTKEGLSKSNTYDEANSIELGDQ